MHGVSGVDLIKRSADASDNTMSAMDFLQASVLPTSSHELHTRAMRIKALKTFEWLAKPNTILELLMTCVTVQPLERLMWTFLKWQSEGSLLDSATTPMAKMASKRAPARQAVDRLIGLMTDGTIFDTPDSPQLMSVAGALFGDLCFGGCGCKFRGIQNLDSRFWMITYPRIHYSKSNIPHNPFCFIKYK